MRRLLLLSFASACGLFPSTDGLSGGDAGGQDATSNDAQMDVQVADSPGDVTVADASDSGCPGTAGPTMVNVGSYCIDSTEVTTSDYAAFLASNPPLGSGPCSFKVTHVPDSNWPPARSDTPITWIDWCDAYSFCQWAGKRLCGKVGGGPAVGLADKTDQWYSACSHADDGTHGYAYGSSFQSGRCNTPELDAGDVVPVASLTTCVGGYQGIFDMIGNVYEWEDSCVMVDDAGADDQCVARSGSFIDPTGPNDTCAGSGTVARNLTQPDFGFRCCSP